MARPQRRLSATAPLIGAVGLIAAAPAGAQLADPQIVVTAQLHDQKPIDTPVAVTALSGEFLSTIGVRDLEEAARFVPGFIVQDQSPNDAGFVIRGITSDTGAAFDEPRVSIFQDGVSISRSRGAYVELFDVQRIEVMRGPQTSLFGRGALIGAVNIVQNKADPSYLAASVMAERGNFDDWTGNAMINLPVSGQAAIRIAGRVRSEDGYVDNLLGGAAFNSQSTRAGRAAFHWGNDGASIDLIGNYERDTPKGIGFKSIGYRPTDPVTGAVIGDAGRTSAAALAAPTGFEGDRGLGVDRRLWSLSLLAKFSLSDTIELQSISGYRRFHAIEVFDADGISLPLLTAAEDARGRQASQELRLRYERGPLTMLFGAAYFRETNSQRTAAQFDERIALARLTNALNGGGLIPGRPATDPAPSFLFDNTAFTGALVQGAAAQSGIALPAAQARAIAANLRPDYREGSTNSARTNAYDLFADATFAVSDRLELGSTLRWSRDTKTTRYVGAVASGRSVLGGLLGAIGLPDPQRTALLTALAAPGAATLPTSALFPVPAFGLSLQPTVPGADNSARLSEGFLSWRLTGRYEARPSLSFYATYARGRRPRVLAVTPPATPGGSARFDRLPHENVGSAEIGLKAISDDRRWTFDAAAYRYRYANFQTIEQQGTQLVTVNAGRAGSYGVETELHWQPVPWFGGFATYTYNHSRFLTGARDGNHFRLTPDHAASAGLMIDVPAGPGTLRLVPSLTWQSRIFFDDNNDRPDLQTRASGSIVADTVQDEVQKSYALVNARIAYRFAGGAEIELFGNNLFNRHYIKDAGNTGDDIGMPTFIAGRPRLYGVRARFAFGG